jgi:hypothetical protein
MRMEELRGKPVMSVATGNARRRQGRCPRPVARAITHCMRRYTSRLPKGSSES